MAFPNPWPVPGSVMVGNIVGDHIYFDDCHTGGVAVGSVFSRAADQGDWLVTDDVDATITIVDDEPGGVLRIVNNVDALDQIQLQLNGEAFKVAVGKDIIFEARLKVDDADDVRWGFGSAT